MKARDKGNRKEYRVIFNVEGAPNEDWENRFIEHTKQDFVNAYNIFCDKADSGLTDVLNLVFDKYYPEYSKQANAEDYQTAYNRWMRDGYKEICSIMNSQRVSQIFDFDINDELQFIGVLRLDSRIKMSFTIE